MNARRWESTGKGPLRDIVTLGKQDGLLNCPLQIKEQANAPMDLSPCDHKRLPLLVKKKRKKLGEITGNILQNNEKLSEDDKQNTKKKIEEILEKFERIFWKIFTILSKFGVKYEKKIL